ncbi:hypothetical protein [Bacteroides sp. An322]|uniref:hypothetical protein n=1 Tax=Bacteroides sp. An322 TaxID=1965632 RepID=UPI000B37BAF4|nr:hypothetical protein [Bacteroides sp. An322]OUO18722.1 hypothetical protein B5F91_09435 [Bacteroides sp. An322]
MIKYVVLMIGLLLLSSCKESESESDITKEMRDYISNNVDGSYGFFERNIVKEHIDGFSWKSDIYRIQHQLYMYASQRRTVLANSYTPIDKTIGWLSTRNFFESNFEEPQGYAKKIKESYITEEEREVCDYVYYSQSVPEIRKMIKELEENEFHGDRIYYACGYRMASGAVVYKQFILYKSDEEDHITKFELKYNYDMLRDFVQYTLNVDLEKPYIQTLLTKYKAIEGKDKESQNSFFTIPTSTISNKYSTIFRRLGN